MNKYSKCSNYWVLNQLFMDVLCCESKEWPVEWPADEWMWRGIFTEFWIGQVLAEKQEAMAGDVAGKLLQNVFTYEKEVKAFRIWQDNVQVR